MNASIKLPLPLTNALPVEDTIRRAKPSKVIFKIAAREFSDRFRSGWVIASAAVWLGAICLTSFFGLIQIGQIGIQGYERTVISLLNLIQYLVPLLALLIGHDLVVAERQDRTLALILSTGITRFQFLLGKFAGGVLTISFPLILGFIISGVVIGLNGNAKGLLAFVKLALSGLALAITFLAAGLTISAFLRTRVQALVAALLTWCFAVFVFDLVVLGTLLAVRSPVAAQEIEVACDTMHVNSSLDIHSAFDTLSNPARQNGEAPMPPGSPVSFSWILLNPVDLFRTMNLPSEMNLRVPLPFSLAATVFWISGLFTLAYRAFRSKDL